MNATGWFFRKSTAVARATRFLAVAVLAVPVLTSCVSRISYRELAQEYYNLGNAFFDLGDFERSYQYYQRAVELDSSLPAAGYNLGRLHLQRGEYDSALEVMERLLESDPENGLYLETVAYIHFQAEAYDRAREGYTALIETFPGRSRLRYNLALLELDQGRPEIALEVLLEGADIAGDDGDYSWLIAEAAYEGEDYQQAELYLDRYRTLMKDNDAAQVKLARRYAVWDYPLAALDVLSDVPRTVNGDPALMFLESRLILTATPDFDGGLARLHEALDGGFDDDDELVALIEDLRPTDREVVRAVINDRGLLPEIDNDSSDDEAE